MSAVKAISAPAASRRRYHSPRRAAQAADTRGRVVEAARRLFVENGLATTIGDIADAADVSPQTVYAAFGSKSGVLIAILDQLTAAAGMGRLPGQLARAAADPRRQLALFVGFDRRLFEAGHDIIVVGLASRGADPDIGAWFDEGERRRRANQAPLVRSWYRSGALRAGLAERRAADILWSLTGPAVYDLFVAQSGWAPGRFERWLTALLERELLR